MFAPEFEHIQSMIKKGLKFKCQQATDLEIIYSVNKKRFEDSKAKFNEIKDNAINLLTFTELNKISKEL